MVEESQFSGSGRGRGPALAGERRGGTGEEVPEKPDGIGNPQFSILVGIAGDLVTGNGLAFIGRQVPVEVPAGIGWASRFPLPRLARKTMPRLIPSMRLRFQAARSRSPSPSSSLSKTELRCSYGFEVVCSRGGSKPMFLGERSRRSSAPFRLQSTARILGAMMARKNSVV